MEVGIQSLSGHVISSVELITVETRYPRTVGRNAVLGSHGSGPTARAVVLRTSEGAAGWGLVGGSPPEPSHLVGRVLDTLFDPALGVIEPAALWADIALHDLAGVLSGQPVYHMLGGHGEPQVPVYDASIYFDDLDPEDRPRGLDAILAGVQDGWDAGYRAFKLKIGRGHRWMPASEGLERDVLITRAVRDVFPPAVLLVDGNNGYTVEGALQYLDRVGDVGLFWVEELFHEHRPGLERLRSWLAANSPYTLIADGEYQPVIEEVVRYACDGLIDVVLMDVVDFGLTRWRKLWPSLQGSGVYASPHAWGLPLKTLYAAHMAAGMANMSLVEAVRGETVGGDTSGYTLIGGLLTVPESPGFGIPVPRPSPAQ